MKIISSLKLTLFGMLLLTVGSILSYDNPANVSEWVLVVPLAILSVNLLAAIITNERIQQQHGLLLFHIGLLGLVLAIGVGRLLYLDANIEVTRDKAFHMDDLMDVRKGPLHSGDLAEVFFVQGQFSVEYGPKLQRGLTYSSVVFEGESGVPVELVVGDDRPLVIRGYRFYTTFNKGFAPKMTWIPENGEMQTGVVHMPSYPLYDYKQSNTWTPPGSVPIKFWLRLQTGLDQEQSWVLSGETSSGVLIVNSEGKRVELDPGDEVELPGGRLKYEALTTWMGYRVFYDPTIQWLFWISMLTIFGMAWHFWQKLSRPV